MNLETKSCEIDIILTKILKEKLDSFIIPITHIVNSLLEKGEFYDEWKNTMLQTLQKRVVPPQRSLITEQLVISNFWQ